MVNTVYDRTQIEPDVSACLQGSVRDAARFMLRLRKVAKTHFGSASRSEAAWNLLLSLHCVDGTSRGRHLGSIAKRADIQIPRLSVP